MWLMDRESGPGVASTYSKISRVSGDVKVFEWEQLGEPIFVFGYTAMVVGRQCLVLVVIALQVFSTRVQRFLQQAQVKNYLMQCDEEAIGVFQDVVCETTKAFVRCFPVVSILVAVVVASQLILCQRLFYLMIRNGVLVDFQNLSPFKDPLFWWVLVNGVLAMSHFGFHMLVAEQMHIGKDNLENVVASLKQDAIFFGLPAMFYVVFLYLSYDVEWLLLPLSKFWEADPEWAYRTSRDLVFVTENVACKASLEDPGSIQDVAEAIVRVTRSYDEMEESENHSPSNGQQKRQFWVSEKRQQKLHGPDCQDCTHQHAPARQGWIKRAWIAKLLLDNKLVARDAKCQSFQCWWLTWITISVLMCIGAIALLVMQLKNDVEDILAGHGEDYVAVTVIGINVVAMLAVLSFYMAELLFHW